MDLKNLLTDKEQWVKAGKTAVKLGKVIAWEGTKAVILKGAAKTITTSFDEGMAGVKKLTFDEVVGIKEDNEPKKKWFSKKKKEGNEAEELLEEVGNVINMNDYEEVKLDDVKVEIIDKK